MPRLHARSLLAGIVLAGAAVTPALSEPAGEPVQISDIGPAGDGAYDAGSPRAALGGSGGLVLFSGEPYPNEDELYARRVDAAGLPVGDQFRVTTVGDDEDTGAAARNGDLAYNSKAGEYLAVWSNAPSTPGDEQIKGQRISADGTLLGSVADISQLSAGSGDNQRPRVVYAAGSDEYLVIWRDAFTNEVYGQRLAGADGAEVGEDDFLISTGAPDDAERMGLAYNPDAGEFLAVWNDESAADGEEIFARRISAEGALLGEELELSERGPAGDASFDSDRPAVAYSPTTGEFLVGWHGDMSPNAETEIFVQRVSAAGDEIGDDLRISFHGPDGDTAHRAERPSIAWDATAARWLVVWEGTASLDGELRREDEVFGRRLMGDGTPDGETFRMSHQGPDGDPSFDADNGVAAFSPGVGHMLVFSEGTQTFDASRPDEGDRQEDEVFSRGERQPSPPPPAPTPTPTPTPGPGVVIPPPVKASQVIRLRSNKRCVKRRRMKLRLREPAGVTLKRAVVRVNGKKVRVVRGAKLRKAVKLRRLPKRRFTVKVKAKTTDGRTFKRKRSYRACKRKR